MRRSFHVVAILVLGGGLGATGIGPLAAGATAVQPHARTTTTCQTSWKAAVSGDWFDAASWTHGVPTAALAACITVAGTYTVTASGAAQAGSLTLGSTSGSTTQTLAITSIGCGGGTYASLTLATASTVARHGDLQLTSTACSGNPDLLAQTKGTLVNSGTLDLEGGAGGARQLSGSFTNDGTVTVATAADLLAGSTFTNAGPVDIADGQQWTVDAASGSASSKFVNATGGAVNSPGSAQSGVLYVGSGNAFTEGAGTTDAADVYVDGSSLTYSGAGASQIVTRDSGTLTGAPSAGQSLTLQSVGCGGGSSVTETLTGSATNAGTITLTSIDCSGNPDIFTVPAGDTLTNTGTVATTVGAGATRTIKGDITSRGSISIGITTAIAPATLFDNGGSVTVAKGAGLSINNAKHAVVIDDTGGSFQGGGGVYGGTFEQGAGTIHGQLSVTNAVTDFTGTGLGTIVAKQTGVLEGTLVAGQAYTLQSSGCGGGKTVQSTTSGAVVNGGTVTLTSTACSGNPDTLVVGSGSTFTNTGSLVSAGGSGGTRTITGPVTNKGAVTVDANTSWSGGTWTNEGAVAVADGITLSVPASTTTNGSEFVNGAGGAVNSPGSAQSGVLYVGSGNAFTEGAGTTDAADVYVDGSSLTYGGAGASQIVTRDSGTLTGAPSAGQSLTLQSVGCGGGSNVAETLTGSATNAGTITLSSIDCSGNSDLLAVGSGTLTSSGTIDVEPGAGGVRQLSGALVNTGTLTVNAAADLLAGSSLLNQGSVEVADNVQLSVDAASGSSVSSVTNGSGGSVTTSGDASTGDLYVLGGDSFTEGAGKVVGGPVYVDGSSLTYSGAGASQIVTRDSGTLTGAPSAGQSLTLQSVGCGGGSNVAETLTGSATNAGTITLSSIDCSGNSDTFTVPTGDKLTNTGTLVALEGAGGTRSFTGALVNDGVVGPSDGPTLAITGSYTQESGGDLAVTAPNSAPTLSVSGTATLAGKLTAVPTSGSTFTAGQTFPALTAGTVKGTFGTVVGAKGQTWKAIYSATAVQLEYV